MDAAYLSAFSALAGSAIGGCTSLVASLLTQRLQVGAQQAEHELTRREDLYKEFIDEASKSYADAIQHTEIDVAKVVHLYALVSRMRTRSSQQVVEEANLVAQLVVETYRGPNRTIQEEAEHMRSGGLDPLLAFSETCREELRSVSRARLTWGHRSLHSRDGVQGRPK
jgi:hypothetical protein